ncbi:MAG: cation diffusion facilitator family transporter [Candidatus Altiarchaeales archaeon]|nr:cation diffusion facilitator family transporter [Candidatus Altiarchaeales archaeon]MBD3416941.1 cation diffusion facilitator family transporter [Candidatus Altiarchaeales archaeon]
MQKEYYEVKRVLVLVLALNLLVALMKFFFGLLANSLSMMADAAHSLFDSTSNIIGLVGISFAYKPPDEDHPYGHEKIESFATLIIALLLILTSFGILKGAFDRVLNPVTPEITSAAFAVMAFTVVVNVLVSSYENRRGLELGSRILVTDSLHTRSDILTSLSVIIGLFAVRAGYPVVDTALALFIGAYIAKTGYRIIKDSCLVLCDASPLDEKDVKSIARSVSGVRSCHKVRTRGWGSNIYVDLHMLVDPDMHVKEAHDLTEKLEERLKEEFKGIKDVIVHIEPDD